jgi:protein-tyrosine-phosphatase
MVEYRQNPATLDFVLMEVNGRFWGSLPLAVAAGVDFPYHLYQVLTQRAAPRTSGYRIGVYCRNLGKDLGWFQERLRAGAGLPARVSLVCGEFAAGAKHLLSGKERCDTITLDDPAPGATELWNGLVASTGKLARRGLDRGRRSAFLLLASTKAWRRAERRRLRRMLRANPRILFVCRGNICRSPFAEAYANLRLFAAGLDSIQTSSAGSYPVADRPSPEAAREVCRAFGVSLDANRSRVLDSALTAWAGAIVCMDARDEQLLRSTFPEAGEKVFYLGAFNGASRRIFIADPWSKPVEEFRRCYAEVAAGVDGLIEAMKD